MGECNRNTEETKLSKDDKIKLVKKILDEVKLELGENFAFVSKTRISEIVQGRLPKQPIYDVPTIIMIMNDTYK